MLKSRPTQMLVLALCAACSGPSGDCKEETADSGVFEPPELACDSAVHPWDVSAPEGIAAAAEVQRHPLIQMISAEANVLQWSDEACPVVYEGDGYTTISGPCTSASGATYEGSMVWDDREDFHRSEFTAFSVDYEGVDGTWSFGATGAYSVVTSSEGATYLWDLSYSLDGDQNVGMAGTFSPGTFLNQGAMRCASGTCALEGYVFVLQGEGEVGDFCVREEWTEGEGTCFASHTMDVVGGDPVTIAYSDDCDGCFSYTNDTSSGTYCPE